LPKYALTQPPIDSVAYAQFYPGSDGFRSREIRADNEGAYYTLNQFGHIRVDQVSIRSNITGRSDFSDTSLTFDQEDRFDIETNSFDETNVIIPLSAYQTKINVPPPGEIFISRGLRINGFDDTFRTFDSNRQEFSEATPFAANRFDSGNLTFDLKVHQFDQDGTTFDADNITFDPVTFDERIYERDTSATTFESFDSTSRLFDTGSLAGLFDSDSTDIETPYTFDNVLEQFDESQGGAISSSVTYDEGT
jgi:hypothetical protein